MIKIDIKKFLKEHIVTITIQHFFRSRIWFGWWWTSICNIHMNHDKTCHLCRDGWWYRSDYCRHTIVKIIYKRQVSS